jgi:opacity protein-like surface antigen
MRTYAFVGVVALSLFLSLRVKAEEGVYPARLFARVENGVAFVVSKPQTDRFHPGYQGVLDLGVERGWLDLKATGMLFELPGKKAYNGEDAVFGGAGAGFRVRPPAGMLSFDPFLDATAMCVFANSLARFGYTFAVGAHFDVTDNGALRMGPVVRYTQVTGRNNPAYDDRDAHLISVGLSFELGESKTSVRGQH